MISRLASLSLGVLIAVCLPALAADGYSVQAPLLGHVFDQETGSLHRLNGIPGASWVGEAVDLGIVVTRAHIAPNHQYAIVRDEEGRTLFVDLTAESPAPVPIEGSLEGATGVIISPSARRAAIYSTDAGEIQLLEGLPGAPAVGETLELEGGVGEWSAFAISDKGVILAATAMPAGGSLHMMAAGRSTEHIGSVQRVGDIAFFAGSNDAVVTDTAADEVVLYRDLVARRQSMVIASADDGVRDPFAAEPTGDGRFVAVGLRDGIAAVPLHGGVPVFTECACAMTSLAPLADGNVFRLTDDLAAPIQIAQVGAEPRVLFVPALQRETDSVQ